MDASKTSIRQAVFGRKYRKSSWICFLLNTFDQQSGINAVGLYANRFLVRMEEQSGDSFFITPLQGTYLLGATNLVFCSVSLYTINKLGRRTHYILGQFFMAVFLFICGYATIKEEYVLFMVSLCAFFMSSTLS